MEPSDQQALARVLGDERDCLRAGAFGQLSGLADRKLALIERVTACGSQLRGLRALRTMAVENQRLIEAALQGVRAAQNRLKSVRDAETGMTAYTSEGQSVRLPVSAATVERRA